MITKTEAIVLHSVKYGEHKLIVDMFTRQQGRVSFVVPLPRTARSRQKKQYFQPLTLLHIEADIRPQVQLQRLSDVSILTPLTDLLSSPDKLSIALFVDEFLCHALRDEQQNAPLFDYVRTGIEWLDGCSDHFANFHLVFLMRLSRFLGIYPNLEVPGSMIQGSKVRETREQGASDQGSKGQGSKVRETREQGASDQGSKGQGGSSQPDEYFDLRAASFTAAPPLHRDFLMPQEAAHIRTLMRMDFATMHLFRLSRAERHRILDILLTFYRLHLPAFPELRSVTVLSELYSHGN